MGREEISKEERIALAIFCCFFTYESEIFFGDPADRDTLAANSTVAYWI